MEQRKHTRIKKTIAVQIEDSFGMIIDISKEGMRLIPDTLPRKLGDIQMYLITESGELIQLKGSITRIVDRKDKESKYELGITLPNPPENYIKYVEALGKNKTPDVISHEDAPQDLVQAFAGVNEGDQSLGGIIQPGQQASSAEIGQPGQQETPHVERIELPMDGLVREAPQPVQQETQPGQPDERVEIPLDAAFQQETQPDETVEMPLNGGGGLDQETQPKEEVDFPLDDVFQGDQPVRPVGAQLPTPGGNEDLYLDQVLQGTPTASKPAISPEEEQSLNGIFKAGTQQPTSPPASEEEKESDDELSLDNLFNDK
ncbi:MAG: PilZ domain-containing protein [Candidatus Aminicenantes bacterium]|nr:PilZ domain-containing protein [Candidatus Aminicenantes bacterium]